MAITDNKKVQTFINRVADEMVIIRAAMERMQMLRDLFVTVNPSVVNTPLEGNVTVLGTAITSLKAEVDKSIWTGLIAAKVTSHRGEAL